MFDFQFFGMDTPPLTSSSEQQQQPSSYAKVVSGKQNDTSTLNVVAMEENIKSINQQVGKIMDNLKQSSTMTNELKKEVFTSLDGYFKGTILSEQRKTIQEITKQTGSTNERLDKLISAKEQGGQLKSRDELFKKADLVVQLLGEILQAQVELREKLDPLFSLILADKVKYVLSTPPPPPVPQPPATTTTTNDGLVEWFRKRIRALKCKIYLLRRRGSTFGGSKRVAAVMVMVAVLGILGFQLQKKGILNKWVMERLKERVHYRITSQ